MTQEEEFYAGMITYWRNHWKIYDISCLVNLVECLVELAGTLGRYKRRCLTYLTVLYLKYSFDDVELL